MRYSGARVEISYTDNTGRTHKVRPFDKVAYAKRLDQTFAEIEAMDMAGCKVIVIDSIHAPKEPPVGEVWVENGFTYLRVGAVKGSAVQKMLERAGWAYRRFSATWRAAGTQMPPIPYTMKAAA